MGSTAQQTLNQFSSITLDNVEEIYDALKSSEKSSPLSIDLSHVKQIDTAGAQVLLSFAGSTHTTYRNCSDPLLDFLTRTGLAHHFPLEKNEVSK